MLEVITPGLLTTVQDSGRPDAAPLGVPRSGACDPLALAAANLLLGNPWEAPALECSLLGPELVVLEDCTVALAGADFGAVVPELGLRLRPGSSLQLQAGSTLAFSAARDGARGYLSLTGGIDVPHVLGSASTCLVGGFGGIDGRPLRAGDRLVPLRRWETAKAAAAEPIRRWPGPGPSSGVGTATATPAESAVRTLRLVAGPHAARSGIDALRSLLETVWEVSPRCDRMGVRLLGPAPIPAGTPGLVSTGMTWGSVQAPPGGAPIVLLADGPTVGGYPVVGVVISVDRPILGQLRPADSVRFQAVDIATAQNLLLEQDRRLDQAAAALGAPLSRHGPGVSRQADAHGL